MKKFHTGSVIIGIALLSVLIWKIGADELWKELARLGWGLVPLIGIEGVADFFHTLGWRHCLTGQQRNLPLSDYIESGCPAIPSLSDADRQPGR